MSLPVAVTEDLRHWVNDGLMAIFFFVMGLEIKRELVTGELRDPRAAMLPVLAACGGVALPAVIFLSIITGGPAVHGWGIPIATDIAFALGVLALLGNRVPVGAKLFLLTIVIVDDIIAITVIAIAYSDSISPAWLGGAAAGLIGVIGLRVVGVKLWPYVLVALAVWFATLESGVQANVASARHCHARGTSRTTRRGRLRPSFAAGALLFVGADYALDGPNLPVLLDLARGRSQRGANGAIAASSAISLIAGATAVRRTLLAS